MLLTLAIDSRDRRRLSRSRKRECDGTGARDFLLMLLLLLSLSFMLDTLSSSVGVVGVDVVIKDLIGIV